MKVFWGCFFSLVGYILALFSKDRPDKSLNFQVLTMELCLVNAGIL